MTKSQVDRLGLRLKQGPVTEADLRSLDSYRRSFLGAYEQVVPIIRDRLGLEPTGRPTKSTTSVIEKLLRESIRLSQIQDIAGCRVVVDDVVTQDSAVENLVGLFSQNTVMDRRQRPSHGYRAVHVIAYMDGTPVEIQVRSALQHLWAELSEKLSDTVDPAIKYGGGPEFIQKALGKASDSVAKLESAELQLAKALSGRPGLSKELKDESSRLKDEIGSQRMQIAQLLRVMIAEVSKWKED